MCDRYAYFSLSDAYSEKCKPCTSLCDDTCDQTCSDQCPHEYCCPKCYSFNASDFFFLLKSYQELFHNSEYFDNFNDYDLGTLYTLQNMYVYFGCNCVYDYLNSRKRYKSLDGLIKHFNKHRAHKLDIVNELSICDITYDSLF